MSDLYTWQCSCLKHGGVLATRAITARTLQAVVADRDKEIAGLWALVEIIKEVDTRFGHFRELKGLNESGPSEALADMADIIHKAAQAAESEATE